MLNRKIQLSRGQAPRYPGTCRKLSKEEIVERLTSGRKPTLRFRIPENKLIEFVDLVKGPQHFNSDDIGDFIVRRADSSSSFLFSNAIDDSLMEVTHVIRGEDHLANTPRQLMILKALKMRHPEYGHLSMILGDDGAPLSKRHGSFSLHDLYQQGYLPQAVLNYLARLSHTYEEQHLLSFNALAEHFNLEKLSRAPARFDKHQLLHWQKEAVMALDSDLIWEWLGSEIQQKVPASSRVLFAEVMRQNIHFPQEASKWSVILFEHELPLAHNEVEVLKEAGSTFFIELQNLVKQHGADLKRVLDELKKKLNVSGKKLFMPVRVALTGELHGPELAHIAVLLGAEQIQQRFNHALELIEK